VWSLLFGDAIAFGRFEAFEKQAEAFREALDPEIVWYPIEAKRSPAHSIDAAMPDRKDGINTWDPREFETLAGKSAR
jgi:hypothetical protein